MADSGTYDQATITRRQKIAEQMLADSSKPLNIRSWAQGLSHIAGVGADAFALNRLDKQAEKSRAADTAALMGILGGDGAAAPPSSGSLPPAQGASEGTGAPTPPVDDSGAAIAGIESGGKYDALGPVTKTGDRAYGKYQVMGANIPEWTRAHTGREMTPQEFVASPEAQDAVFKGQFGNYASKYGPEGAARAWFAGEGGMNDPGRRDHLGTSVADYSKKFTDATGPQAIARAMTPPVIDTGGPAKPDAQGVYGPDATMMPPIAPPAAATGGPAAVAQAMTGAPGAGQPPAPATAPLAAQNAPQGIHDQQRAAIARLMSATPGSPAYQLGLQLAGQALKPKDYGFQTLPDGTILRTDPHQGTVQPIYQGAAKPTFGVIGKDRYSNDVHGFIDPQKRSVEPVSAVPNTAPGQGQTDPSVTGDPFLETLPKPQADQIKGIVEGRIAPPGAFALKTPYWQKMMTDVAQYEPGFDLTKWGARSATAKDFASGKSAQNITAFNTAIQHLDTLDKAAGALDNYNLTPVNTVKNIIASKTGDPAIKNFEVAKTAVADELTRAFRGTGGNVHDLVQWENAISASNSPAQLKGAIKQAIELLRGRIESLGDTYNRGMNTKTEAVKLLSPKAQEAIGRLSGEAGPEKKTETAPKVGEEKEFKQGVGVWDGTKWVPKGGPGA